MSFKIMDKVKLKPQYNNNDTFVVCDKPRKEGKEIIVGIYPEIGGMLCCASVESLERIK